MKWIESGYQPSPKEKPLHDGYQPEKGNSPPKPPSKPPLSLSKGISKGGMNERPDEDRPSPPVAYGPSPLATEGMQKLLKKIILLEEENQKLRELLKEKSDD